MNLKTILEEFRKKFTIEKIINNKRPHVTVYFAAAEYQIKSFLQAKIIEALESVVPEEEMIEGLDDAYLGYADGWNACSKEILSNIEKFKQ